MESSAGAHLVEWDGLDAAGVEVSSPDCRAELRVLVSNTSYEWEGVIGNTGPRTGARVLRGFDGISDMVIEGSTVAFAWGYMEAQRGFSLARVGSVSHQVATGHPDIHTRFSLAATDGELAYFANQGSGPNSRFPSYYYLPLTWVVAVNVSTGCEHNFTEGGQESCAEGWHENSCPGGCKQPNGTWLPSPCNKYWNGCTTGAPPYLPGGLGSQQGLSASGQGQYWKSVIDYHWDTAMNASGYPTASVINGTYADAATGLAVQRRGSLLFVAHGFKNQIRAFDKRTGAPVFQASMPQPATIAVTRDDSSIWVVAQDGSSVSKCAIERTGLARMFSLAPHQVGRAGAIAVSPDDELLVADLKSYQLRLFSPNGSLRRTYGQAGGYATNADPAVTHDRFWWTTTDFGVGNDRGTTLAYEPDGSFWVGDAGNRRTLHLSASGDFIGQLMYQPRVYTATVAAAAPQRVFINFLEFEVDYSKPIESSWTLVRNWGAGMPKSFVAWDPAMGIAADAQNPPCHTDVCPGWARSPTGISRYPFAGFKDVGVSSNRTLGMIGIFPRAPALDNVSNLLIVELAPANGLVHVANLSCASCPTYLRTCRLTRTADLRCVQSGGNGSVKGGAWQAVHEIKLSTNASGSLHYDLSSGGTVLTNFSFSAGELGVRPSMVNPHVPSIGAGLPAAGGLLIFDASPGNDLSVGKGKAAPDTANQGNHLGAVSPLTGKWIWQSSPWGRYEAEDIELSLLPQANVTFRQRVLKNSTKIGTYGGNDTSIDFAGSTVMLQVSVPLSDVGMTVVAIHLIKIESTSQGSNVVYGFYGEGWSGDISGGGEANQFLHFHSSGLFLGQVSHHLSFESLQLSLPHVD